MKKTLSILLSTIIAASAFAESLEITEKNQVFTGTQTVDKLTVGAFPYYIGKEGTPGILTVKAEKDPLANSGRIIIRKGSELILETTANTSYSSNSRSGKVDVYGEYVFNHTGGGSPFVGSVVTGKTVNIFSGGTLKITGVGDGGFDINNGTLDLKSGSTVDTSSSKIYIRGTGTSKLIVGDNVTFKQILAIVLGNGAKAITIDTSTASNVRFATLTFKSDTKLTLNLPTQSLTFSALSTTSSNEFTGTEELILNDFRNDVIKFNDISNLSIVDGDYLTVGGKKKIKLTAFDANNNEIILSAGDYWDISTGYLNIVKAAVPEPAEWAVIFGAIALGLAIYRRRK